MKRNHETRKQRPVDEATDEAPPTRPELHPQLETVPDDVPGPSDGKSHKRPRSPDDEAPPSTRLRLHPQFDLLPDDLSDDQHRQLDDKALEVLRRVFKSDVEYGCDRPPPPPIILLQSILAKPGFQVNPQYRTIGGVSLFLEENPDVERMLEEAWNDRTFKKIRNLAVFHAAPQLSTGSSQKSQRDKLDPARLDAAHKAWTVQWLGNSHVLLANLMEKLRRDAYKDTTKDPYNHSISIIQSSGMGKSRLMDSVARSKFCFPFNIRENPPPGIFAYPPSDVNIHLFFKDHLRVETDDLSIERKYLAFFAGLFDCAVEELDGDSALNQVSTGQATIVQRWHEYLADGATEHTVGNKRRDFYGKVVDAAQKLIASSETCDELRQRTLSNGEVFSTYLLEKQNLSQNPPAVQFFIYFDEAHILVEEEEDKATTTRTTRKQTKFHILGRVLGKIKAIPFFVVFLSTNSWLEPSAPSSHMIPSARDWSATTLHAPFTELHLIHLLKMLSVIWNVQRAEFQYWMTSVRWTSWSSSAVRYGHRCSSGVMMM